MKEQERRNALLDATNGIREMYIEEAAVPGKRMKHGAVVRRIVAAAAALAILVGCWLFWPAGGGIVVKDGFLAVPGVLKAYACELYETENAPLETFELTDTIDSFNRTWVPLSNLTVGYGIPLTLQLDPKFYPGAEISFHLSVDYGCFYIKGERIEMQQEVTLKNGQTAVWRSKDWAIIEQVMENETVYYGYILIYADNHLVGYGVVDFICYYGEDILPSFGARKFTTYCFPMIGGNYQNVSEEYVWSQIAKHKVEKEAFDSTAWNSNL